MVILYSPAKLETVRPRAATRLELGEELYQSYFMNSRCCHSGVGEKKWKGKV